MSQAFQGEFLKLISKSQVGFEEYLKVGRYRHGTKMKSEIFDTIL